MDLSKIDGLTEEQVAAITELYGAETLGLKTKVDELLTEKKTASQKAKEAEEIAEQARLAATEAEKQRLANEGKFDELKKLHEKELAEATAKYEQEATASKEALNKYHKGAALNQALSLIHDDYKAIAEPLLSNMIKVDYNENQQAVISFKQGDDVVAGNVDEFKSWASEQDAFKKILNGVNSGGAGSNGGNNTGGNTDKDSAFKQRLKAAGLTQS